MPGECPAESPVRAVRPGGSPSPRTSPVRLGAEDVGEYAAPSAPRPTRIAHKGEPVFAIASRVLERVRQNRHPVERALVVDAPRECAYVRREPRGAERPAGSTHTSEQPPLAWQFIRMM